MRDGSGGDDQDMARTRPNLEKAVNEILLRHGVEGKRLSFRQAERRTGLSPATVSELAKGNARTPETVRRFAEGLGEDVNRLLLLAGFTPEDLLKSSRGVDTERGMADPVAFATPALSDVWVRDDDSQGSGVDTGVDKNRDQSDNKNQNQNTEWDWNRLEANEIVLLERVAALLCRVPSGASRLFMQEQIRHTAELLERFVELESGMS